MSTDANAELNWNGSDASGSQDGTGTGPISFFATDPGSNEGELDFTYANTSGQVVSGTIGTDFTDAFNGTTTCGVWGTVTASS